MELSVSFGYSLGNLIEKFLVFALGNFFGTWVEYLVGDSLGTIVGLIIFTWEEVLVVSPLVIPIGLILVISLENTLGYSSLLGTFPGSLMGMPIGL